MRVPSSLYTMNRAALNVFQSPTPPSPQEWKNTTLTERQSWLQHNYRRWNQMSDRLKPSNQVVVTPTRGNTTRTTTTSHRPGAGSPGGKGVDVKHDSYARYLARKKGKVLTKKFIAKKPLHGNKIQSYNIINKSCCPTLPTTICNQTIFNHLAPPRRPCANNVDDCCPENKDTHIIYTQQDFDNWLADSTNHPHVKLSSSSDATTTFVVTGSHQIEKTLCISQGVILAIDSPNNITVTKTANIYNSGLIKLTADATNSPSILVTNEGNIYNCGIIDINIINENIESSTTIVVENNTGHIYGAPGSIFGVSNINDPVGGCVPCHDTPGHCN